jgi:hypothetical protein
MHLAVAEGRLRELDAENVIEELEGLTRGDRRSLQSHVTTLAVHLLKLRPCDEFRRARG